MFCHFLIMFTCYHSACKHGGSSNRFVFPFLLISGKQQMVSTSCKYFHLYSFLNFLDSF